MQEPLTRVDVLSILESATSPDELRAAVQAVALYMRSHPLDEVLLHKGAELMDRVYASGVRFGSQHPPH